MKKLKMISKLSVFLSFSCTSLIMSCQDHGLLPSEQSSTATTTEVTDKGDYLIFGHVSGFCMNCDVLYKIENDSIYATKFCTNLNPDSAVFFFLKRTSKDSVAGKLPANIPSKLFSEQQIHIGTYRPDVGHYYIAVKTKNSVRHWYVEAYGVPEYLTSYLADVRGAMDKLR